MAFTTNPRNQWYDRNGITRDAGFNGAATAPHVSILRWSYTVPSTKKFMLQTYFIASVRDTVTATPSEATASIFLYGLGVGGRKIIQNNFIKGALGDGLTLVGSGGSVLMPTDRLEGYTEDASVGGTVHYTNSITGVEYDA